MNFPIIPVNANILITGAAGFIGSHFAELLFNGNHTGEVLLLDRLSKGGHQSNIDTFLTKPNFIFLEADIRNVSAYSEFLKNCSLVFHFAAESHVDRSIQKPDEFIESNIVGTYRLLEACRSISGLRFVMISTDEVYGSNSGNPSTENDVFSPSSIYSASKASAELLCLANFKTHFQDIVIVRPCNNFGPRQHSEKFIPTIITKVLAGEPIPVYGSGLNAREWIDVRENVKAISVIALKGLSGEAYNVGSQIRIKNLELISIICQHLKDYKVEIEFTEDRKGHDSRYALESSKLKNTLNWIYTKNFEESIKETVEWYKANLPLGYKL
jgi:dTDP-glucose 4,6-dehydratase